MASPSPEKRSKPPAGRLARNPAIGGGGRAPARSPRVVVVTALAGVAVAVAGFLVVTQLSRTRADTPEITRFVVGQASALAPRVDADGPLLFQDVSDGDRDVFVQHLGNGNWVAFEAFAPGNDRGCQLQWRPTRRDFVDPCSDEVFPADGEGLVAYPAEVDEDGRLVIDLRPPAARPG